MRVKPEGLEVLVPEGRTVDEALDFVRGNREWVKAEWDRVRKLRVIRRPRSQSGGELLYQGELTSVRLVRADSWRGPSKVEHEGCAITLTCGSNPRTPPSKTLENWLRQQARAAIEGHLGLVASRVKRQPGRVYVMGQRTKWGNCSVLGNLSFNWRLVMAPDYVLQYIVTHEVVHLVVPNHSQRFWLTVQSLCKHYDRARQWLVANGARLMMVQLRDVLPE